MSKRYFLVAWIFLAFQQSFALFEDAPNIYHWMERNSYICDVFDSSKPDNPVFIFEEEAEILKCSQLCGDPIETKKACGRMRNRPDSDAACFTIPEICIREYIHEFTTTSHNQNQNEVKESFDFENVEEIKQNNLESVDLGVDRNEPEISNNTEVSVSTTTTTTAPTTTEAPTTTTTQSTTTTTAPTTTTTSTTTEPPTTTTTTQSTTTTTQPTTTTTTTVASTTTPTTTRSTTTSSTTTTTTTLPTTTTTVPSTTTTSTTPAPTTTTTLPSTVPKVVPATTVLPIINQQSFRRFEEQQTKIAAPLLPSTTTAVRNVPISSSLPPTPARITTTIRPSNTQTLTTVRNTPTTRISTPTSKPPPTTFNNFQTSRVTPKPSLATQTTSTTLRPSTTPPTTPIRNIPTTTSNFANVQTSRIVQNQVFVSPTSSPSTSRPTIQTTTPATTKTTLSNFVNVQTSRFIQNQVFATQSSSPTSTTRNILTTSQASIPTTTRKISTTPTTTVSPSSTTTTFNRIQSSQFTQKPFSAFPPSTSSSSTLPPSTVFIRPIQRTTPSIFGRFVLSTARAVNVDTFINRKDILQKLKKQQKILDELARDFPTTRNIPFTTPEENKIIVDKRLQKLDETVKKFRTATPPFGFMLASSVPTRRATRSTPAISSFKTTAVPTRGGFVNRDLEELRKFEKILPKRIMENGFRQNSFPTLIPQRSTRATLFPLFIVDGEISGNHFVFNELPQPDLQDVIFGRVPVTTLSPTSPQTFATKQPKKKIFFFRNRHSGEMVIAPAEHECVDGDTACDFWAKHGECKANPVYMLTVCRLSCHVCTPFFS